MPLSAVLGIDIGTSSVKAVLVDPSARLIASGRVAYPTAQPAPGLSEQRPGDWREAAIGAVRAALDAAGDVAVAAISFSGHMSAPVLVDGTGAALGPCHTITDQRASGEAAAVDGALANDIAQRIGNLPGTHLTLPKLLWWRDHEPAIWTRTAAILTPKDWLRLWMTGDVASDPTDAGNSMLFEWARWGFAEDLAARAGIDGMKLPRLREPEAIAGRLLPGPAAALGLPAGIPVVTGAADMPAMLLGAGVDLAADVSVTIGTSANVIAGLPGIAPALVGRMNILPYLEGRQIYAIASHFGGGGALAWLTALLSGEARPDPAFLAPIAAEAAALPMGAEGLLFLPYLSGGGSPDFDNAARGAFLGLSMAHGRAHMLRAIIEGVSADLCLSLDLLGRIAPRRRILFSGGGARLPFWPQILADLSGLPVVSAAVADASTLGAALIAGVGIGWFGGSFAAARALVAPTGEAALPRSDAAAQELRARFAQARAARRPDLLPAP